MKLRQTIIVILLTLETLQQCRHPIFCSQPILTAIANSNIFSDSKSFVDLVLKIPIEAALTNFLSQNITSFVEQSFHSDPNIILQDAKFDDFQQNPSFLLNIKDPNLRIFAKDLNRRWNDLGKKVILDKGQQIGRCKEKCSSFIEQMNGKKILVPGGRFRQSYYWDTYWIVLGLITSEMLDTASLILDNFAIMIETYGFIPNGFRQYYLNRSQPPFYFLMVKKVSQAYSKKGEFGKAMQLQKKHFPCILKENQYWEKTHSINITLKGSVLKVNQYRANTSTARPESYREDTSTVSNLEQSQKKRVLACLSSMAQSGWDFSSRWLQNQSQLRSTIIDSIIPSDLNTLLGLQESYLATLSSKYGKEELVPYFVAKISERKKYFRLIEKEGRYPDFHLFNRQSNPKSIYPTDYLPLLLFSEKATRSKIFNKVVNPASSQLKTGQQWDAPNVWAPNNWILNEIAPAEESAVFAKQWIKTTYCSWKKTGNLYEKYHSDMLGQRGQGGEYVVQTGFGWTNGLALHYIALYGQNYSLGNC